MICAADFLKINERTTSCLILLKFDITTLFAAFGMIVQNWVYPCWSCNPVLNNKNSKGQLQYLCMFSLFSSEGGRAARNIFYCCTLCKFERKLMEDVLRRQDVEKPKGR